MSERSADPVFRDGFDVALALVRRAIRPAFKALWALDVTLGGIVATTRDPLVGQMRLTWWFDALSRLRPGATSGHPVLDALAALMANHDVSADDLAAMVEGWEALLDPLPVSDGALRRFAEQRGDRLFALSLRLYRKPQLPGPGAAWALADFGCRCTDADTAARAVAMARALYASGADRRLPRALRFIAALGADDAKSGRAAPIGGWRLLRALYRPI